MKKIFIFVGFLNVSKEAVYEVLQAQYGPWIKCLFSDKEGYLKAKFDFANQNNRKIEAIFIGPVPHKSFAAGRESSMVSEVSVAGSVTPVYVCRTKANTLKFTKTSVKQAISSHEDYLKYQKTRTQEIQEIQEIEHVDALMEKLFPDIA